MESFNTGWFCQHCLNALQNRKSRVLRHECQMWLDESGSIFVNNSNYTELREGLAAGTALSCYGITDALTHKGVTHQPKSTRFVQIEESDVPY